MDSKHFLKNDEKRYVCGNSTRLDPDQDIISYYHGYAVTAFNDTENQIPKTPENKVVKAKHFVDENHK